MLPAAHRLTSSSQFHAVVRQGSRSGSSTLVVHLLRRGDEPTVQAGFVVSRAVGPSVVRHRVQRKLRHLMAQRLESLPPGAAVVVRAQPEAAAASSSRLAADLDRALAKAAR